MIAMNFNNIAAKALNLRFGVFALSIPLLLFYVLITTGCLSTSPGLPNLFLTSLQHPVNTTHPVHELRVGYFGACYRAPEIPLHCFPTHSLSIENLTSRFGTNTSQSRISQIGKHDYDHAFAATVYFLQQRNFGYMLAGAGFVFIIGLVFLVLLIFMGGRVRLYKSLTKISVFASAAVVLACIVGSYQTVMTLQHAAELGGEKLGISVALGLAVQVLQWMVFGLLVLFGVGVGFAFKDGAGGGGNFP